MSRDTNAIDHSLSIKGEQSLLDALLEGYIALELASVVLIELLLADELGCVGWGGSTGEGFIFLFEP